MTRSVQPDSHRGILVRDRVMGNSEAREQEQRSVPLLSLFHPEYSQVSRVWTAWTMVPMRR
ncbi:hypothetical protein, partial [Streptomyces olivaceus]|uniref:hypothetical protein n=1 Tax=Streptomyces olivaceus TaxID=47716 RepID=UPI00405707FA